MLSTSARPISNAPLVSPLQQTLDELYARFRPLDSGEVATYIPELGRANPDDFAICIATVDGTTYCAGDASIPFTIQSISKPFAYALALNDIGVDRVMEKIAVEPSGEAFNAISLEPVTGRPRNPMINAGAIATSSLIAGASPDEKFARTIDAFSAFAAQSLRVDDAVYVSERDTGHRNRAIAYLLRNAGIVGDDVDEALDRYFRQCSILVNASDLAMMAATLANGGTNPQTNDRVLQQDYVESVLSVMSTCGMYDYAGSWAYRVGMPAKSGVSGGVIAVLPGQLGIAVYSSRLDEFGNSVRGVAVCEAFSRDFGLHLLRPITNPGSSVLTSYTLADVCSKRRRSVDEMRALASSGGDVRVMRVQGRLVLSTAEVVLRRAIDETHDSRIIIFDCERIRGIDAPVSRLFSQFTTQFIARGGKVAFAGLREGDGWEPLLANRDDIGFHAFATIDLALEWAEDRVLDGTGLASVLTAEVAPADHPLLSRLAPEEKRALESVLVRREYAAGATIIRQGDTADSVVLLASGEVSVNLHAGNSSASANGAAPHSSHYRIATLGPGATFGELALLDAQPRTADVEAETDAICYVLALTDLDAVGTIVPTLRLKLAEQIAIDLAARLRRADTEILALAS